MNLDEMNLDERLDSINAVLLESIEVQTRAMSLISPQLEVSSPQELLARAKEGL